MLIYSTSITTAWSNSNPLTSNVVPVRIDGDRAQVRWRAKFDKSGVEQGWMWT